jgi:bifunctional N-acetylglucosamine-1-phosphate-uridyltransferase/glucosamine-1-phosphate-acetyltransferase GlmU-like protein
MLDTTQSPYNPSAQVERMREIIVGRQLARVEQRLDRLEHFVEQPQLSHLDTLNRIETVEAKFEAARDNMQHQVDQMRLEYGGEIATRRHEVHRLAEQIQATAQQRSEQRVQPQMMADMEQRLGSWLTTWQRGLEQHLEQRENWLIQQLRQELQQVRAAATEQIAAWETNQLLTQQATQAKLSHIAQAARALAESATSWSNSYPNDFSAPIP